MYGRLLLIFSTLLSSTSLKGLSAMVHSFNQSPVNEWKGLNGEVKLATGQEVSDLDFSDIDSISEWVTARHHIPINIIETT